MLFYQLDNENYMRKYNKSSWNYNIYSETFSRETLQPKCADNIKIYNIFIN